MLCNRIIEIVEPEMMNKSNEFNSFKIIITYNDYKSIHTDTVFKKNRVGMTKHQCCWTFFIFSSFFLSLLGVPSEWNQHVYLCACYRRALNQFKNPILFTWTHTTIMTMIEFIRTHLKVWINVCVSHLIVLMEFCFFPPIW